MSNPSPTPKSFSWSHTAYKQFCTCPKQYAHIRVYKDIKDSQNEAALWGDRVHKEIEKGIKEGSDVMGHEFEVYKKLVDRTRQMKGQILTEQKLAVTCEWTPCDWFAPDVWCRGIVDLLVIDGAKAKILDWKTGKSSDFDQLKLFSLLVFANFPEIREIKAAFCMLKTQEITPKKYIIHSKEFVSLAEEFNKKISIVEDAVMLDIFQPRPSGLCNGWCPVESCNFWKPRR